jgi:hypothetical protein
MQLTGHARRPHPPLFAPTTVAAVAGIAGHAPARSRPQH